MTGIQENVLSFVNNVRTKDGGTHEAGMKAAMTKSYNEYEKSRLAERTGQESGR